MAIIHNWSHKPRFFDHIVSEIGKRSVFINLKQIVKGRNVGIKKVNKEMRDIVEFVEQFLNETFIE